MLTQQKLFNRLLLHPGFKYLPVNINQKASRLLPPAFCLLALAWAMSLAMISLTPVQAQSIPGEGYAQQPPPNPGDDAPEGTVPAGSRGPCPDIQQPLTPLVLVTQESADSDQQLRWGFTTQEHPTFWFYVPYTPESIRSAKFSLQTRRGETVYEMPLSLTGIPGVISIVLPTTAAALDKGEWYRSFLHVDVYCTPTTPAQKDSTFAWVKRKDIDSKLGELLGAATREEQAILYVQNGFSYEALNMLAGRENQQEWDNLLRLLGLDAISF